MGAKQNWDAIKNLRRPFVPRFSKRGNTKVSIPENFPNDCARYFASQHWKSIPPRDVAPLPPLNNQAENEGPFTMDELNNAIDRLKPNKAGGPDDLIAEIFRDLNPENRRKLLTLYNQIHDTEEIPPHFNEAHVVQIYKSGKAPEQYSSYRPIALLNLTYKILAKLIQERLRETLDHRIVDFQFGYRKGKSTAEPIFIARRTQELAERSGKTLYMLALDYSKAFDSIPHPKLIECLKRKGASPKNVSLVAALYKHPKFRIKIPEGLSEEFPQDIGIRQGCPLSPYLYIIATSCLMEDLLKDLERHPVPPPLGATYPILLFADDTLLLTEQADQLETLLRLTIDHSENYNLGLNKAKCQLLVTNDPGTPVCFPDQEPITKHTSIKYLGATFHAKLDIRFIMRQKLTDAAHVLRQLLPLWRDTHIPTRWKLIVFNSVVRSRIFYTLETLELTASHQKSLDTLYFKGLRKILHKPSTYRDRYWTHERLLQEANRHPQPAGNQQPKYIQFSKYYLLTKTKLLGHLLRAPPTNLCRRSILTEEGEDLISVLNKKRVGRPRFTWLQECIKDAWQQYTPQPLDLSIAVPELQACAIRRAHPF